MNCNELEKRVRSFPSRYLDNFDYVWKWKISIEKKGESIFNEEHLSEAYRRLSNILPKWQTYRNSENSYPYRTLKESLQNIVSSYKEIRAHSLLEFGDISEKALQRVWHELGRVKEFEGRRNSNGSYYAIAACKPLLLIWGQTPAFDSRVRENLPAKYEIKKFDFRLSFEQWYRAMIMISDDLKRLPECVAVIEKMSCEIYRVGRPIPYGRFLDIYYWIGK